MNERGGTAPGSQSAESGHREPPATELAPGISVGRYVVLERVGTGGMGVVYAAYDPGLDRRVAIKLLRSDRAFGASDDRSSKLMDRCSTPARRSSASTWIACRAR